MLWRSGDAGFRCGPQPIRHCNISPKDAKKGNLVIMETRMSDDDESCMQGPWEKEYIFGLVKNRPSARARAKLANQKDLGDNQDDDLLEIVMYEPYHVEQDVPSIPLWAYIEKEGLDYSEEYPWEKLISLPWLPITKMRVSVAKALCEANGKPYIPQNPKNVIQDFQGTQRPTEIKMKPYVTQQYCHTIKFVMQLDKNEKGSGTEGGLTLNPKTQRELSYIMQAAKLRSN